MMRLLCVCTSLLLCVSPVRSTEPTPEEWDSLIAMRNSPPPRASRQLTDLAAAASAAAPALSGFNARSSRYSDDDDDEDMVDYEAKDGGFDSGAGDSAVDDPDDDGDSNMGRCRSPRTSRRLALLRDQQPTNARATVHDDDDGDDDELSGGDDASGDHTQLTRKRKAPDRTTYDGSDYSGSPAERKRNNADVLSQQHDANRAAAQAAREAAAAAVIPANTWGPVPKTVQTDYSGVVEVTNALSTKHHGSLGLVISTKGRTLAMTSTVIMSDGTPQQFTKPNKWISPRAPPPATDVDLRSAMYRMPFYSGRVCVQLDGRCAIVHRMEEWAHNGEPTFHFRFTEAENQVVFPTELDEFVDAGRCCWPTFTESAPSAADYPEQKLEGSDSDEDEPEDDDHGWSPWGENGACDGDDDDGERDYDGEQEREREERQNTLGVTNPIMRRAIRRTIARLNTKHSLWGRRIESDKQYPAPDDGWRYRFDDELRVPIRNARHLHALHHLPAKYGILCPWTFFPGHAPLHPRCPFCKECGTTDRPISLKGFSGGVRSVIGLSDDYPIVVRRLRHINCPQARIKTTVEGGETVPLVGDDGEPERRKERDFTVCHIWDQMSASLRSKHDMFVFRGELAEHCMLQI